jgi:hypothetical protein
MVTLGEGSVLHVGGYGDILKRGFSLLSQWHRADDYGSHRAKKSIWEESSASNNALTPFILEFP